MSDIYDRKMLDAMKDIVKQLKEINKQLELKNNIYKASLNDISKGEDNGNTVE